jgi:hypothetical protein
MDDEPKPMPCISPEIIALASKTYEMDAQAFQHLPPLRTEAISRAAIAAWEVDDRTRISSRKLLSGYKDD